MPKPNYLRTTDQLTTKPNHIHTMDQSTTKSNYLHNKNQSTTKPNHLHIAEQSTTKPTHLRTTDQSTTKPNHIHATAQSQCQNQTIFAAQTISHRTNYNCYRAFSRRRITRTTLQTICPQYVSTSSETFSLSQFRPLHVCCLCKFLKILSVGYSKNQSPSERRQSSCPPRGWLQQFCDENFSQNYFSIEKFGF
jgi:hypothetical protein